MTKELEDIFKKFKEKDYEKNKSDLFEIFKDCNISHEHQDINIGIHDNYVSIEKKLIYLKIDKCASSSIGVYLSSRTDFIPMQEDFISNLLSEYDIEQIKNYKIFVIIRDPKFRWISGLNELVSYVYKGGISELKIYIEQELKKNNFVFDGHTLSQIECLPPEINSDFISNFILIRLDKKLNEKLSSLIGEDIQISHIYTTSSNQNKKSNLNFCKRMFKTYCQKNPKYYQRYEFDYRLFNLSR